MNQLLFGTAYYDEYMPCERLEQDVAMMKKAGESMGRGRLWTSPIRYTAFMERGLSAD